MPETRCPKCRGTLRASDSRGPHVAQCGGCSGVWLDADSLAAAIEAPQKLWSALSARDRNTELACPDCPSHTLTEATFGDCAVDWCPSCKGIYFDRGEIERVKTTLANMDGRSTLQAIGDGAGFVAGEIIVEAICWVIAKVGDSL